MPTYDRIYLGALTIPARERILDTLRDEVRLGNLDSFTVQCASVGRDDNPRNPGHTWIDTGEGVAA